MSAIKEKILPRSDAGNDASDHRDDPDYLGRAEAPDFVAWAKEFTLSDANIAELRDPEWIILNLVIRGHLTIIVAEPNGGKSTLFAHLSSEMASAGYRVFYVNADIAGSDAARFVAQARQGGWTAMLPDMIVGLSMGNVVERLETMNGAGGDLSDLVFIFDTFKKMTDVIAKKQVREILKLLRSLTAKGATIVLLAHTNKYKDADGRPVFEGTGDVRADADELIYLIPQKNPDGSMTISTLPDKIRGDFEPITFHISKGRHVTRADAYIDTTEARRAQEAFEIDEPDIQVILDAIEIGASKQVEIIEHCKGHRISKRSALRLLKEYAKGARQQWESQRGIERNTIMYYLPGTQI